ncbi:MAG TPA: encapsulin [Armatimonadota bacterium]|nr:encapsulin [Armatimonadota bacterium]
MSDQTRGTGGPGRGPGTEDLTRPYNLTRQYMLAEGAEVTPTDAVQATVNSLVERLLVGRRLFEVVHSGTDVPSGIVWAQTQAHGGDKAEGPTVEVSTAQIAAPSTRLWAAVEIDESEIDLRACIARSSALVDVARQMALQEDRVVFKQVWERSSRLPATHGGRSADGDPAATALTTALGTLRGAGHRGGVALLLAAGDGFRDIESELARTGCIARVAPLFALGIHAVPLMASGDALVVAPEGSGASITVGQNYAVSCIECSGPRLRFGICTTFGVSPGAPAAQCRLSVPEPPAPGGAQRKRG